MRWGLGGILTGALLLIVAQVVLTSSGNTSSGVSTLLSVAQVPAKLAQNWMSPDVPLIPDLSGSSSSSSSSTKSTSSPSSPSSTPPKAPTAPGLPVGVPV